MPTATTSKRATAKKPVRRTGSRRRAARIASRKETCTCTNTCQPEHGFWVNNGPIVHSLCELRDAIRGMSAEQYQYHTARNGNDFTSWIRDCFKDGALAERVARATSQAEAVRTLTKACCK